MKDKLSLAQDLIKIVLKWAENVEKVSKVYRLEKSVRPKRIKFRSQIKVNNVMNRTWKLARIERLKKYALE